MDVSQCSLYSVNSNSRHYIIPSTARGFSLLEVLITLFIMAVGLLSLAALQIQGLRAAHGALLRTQAVALTTEMAERLRSDGANGPNTADIQDWQTRIAQVLPGGDGSVEFLAPPDAVRVRWDDHGEARQVTLSLTP